MTLKTINKMTKIYCILALIAVMAPIIQVAPFFAVSPDSPVYTHFTYMFAHANWIHLFVNAWGLLFLHNLYTWVRVIVAYASAVVLSFFYYPELPVLGASVFITFFTGFMIFWLYKRHRLGFWQVIALLIIGCFVPHIASVYHIIMFLAGIIYNRLEWLIADYKIYTE